MAKLREAVIVVFVRTPFGRASKKKPGFFADVRSDDLAIIAVQALMKRTRVDPHRLTTLSSVRQPRLGSRQMLPEISLWRLVFL